MLNEQYPAETTLNLIIWTPADIEALADGMEYSFSEHDVRASLERWTLYRKNNGLSRACQPCGDGADRPGESGRAEVRVPVDLLETLLITAEQALWGEWTARDGNHPVPESVSAAWLIQRKCAHY
jgi:hypothetical protein